MTVAICFLIGGVMGVAFTAMHFHRYYKSEIWQAEKEVLLSIQHARRARYDRQRTRAELEIDELIEKRLK